MPPRRTARNVSTNAQLSQNPARRLTAIEPWHASSRKPKTTRVAQPLQHAAQAPTLHPNHGQPVSVPQTPANQHLLAQYFRTGEYSDLEAVSAGVVHSVHRIIVCSESPVLKDMCANLGRDQRLELDQYDLEILDRILDFCYRRTYLDGEYPEIAAHFLTSMTAEDVLDALEEPLVVMSDVEDPEWTADCTRIDLSNLGCWLRQRHLEYEKPFKIKIRKLMAKNRMANSPRMC